MAVKKAKKKEVMPVPQTFDIKYDIQIQCSQCKAVNEVVYIANKKEDFICKKCGQKHTVVMSFIAMVENPPGVRTMMIEPNEKRRLNANIGGVNLGHSGTDHG